MREQHLGGTLGFKELDTPLLVEKKNGTSPPPEPIETGEVDLPGTSLSGAITDQAEVAPPPRGDIGKKRLIGSFALVLSFICLSVFSVFAFDEYRDMNRELDCIAGRANDCGSNVSIGTSEEMRWVWLGLAISAGLGAIVSLILAAPVGWRAVHPNLRLGQLGIGAMFLSSAALLLGLGATATVVVFILPIDRPTFTNWSPYLAVGAGLAAALGVAAINAIVRGDPASSWQSHSRVYDELHARWNSLDRSIQPLCGSTNPLAAGEGLKLIAGIGCAEAAVHRDRVQAALGLGKSEAPENLADRGAKWITGTGYVELWNRLHDAEEALLVLEPRGQVVAAALFDETRLIGSNIENSASLLDRLRRVIHMLGGTSYLSGDVQKLFDTAIPTKSDDEEGAIQARLVLRDVRHAINQFRDKSREALIVARNQLMWTGMLTGVAAYVILVLAILAGADQDAILAAAVFFLTGAVVGLFDQLRVSGTTTMTEEDYGLRRARLVYTPYLSGLAAVGGVLLTAMLYATITSSVVTYQAPGADAANNAARVVLDPPPLSLIFDLNNNRFGLVIAAVFGLTPSLLVDRLQGEANRYKADLQSTSGQERRT